MSRLLVVLVGAGASHDLVIPEQSMINTAVWRPPLTKQIFQANPFHKLLQSYPKAQAAATDYHLKYGRESEVGLESFIQKLRESDDEHEMITCLELQLYLQHMISVTGHTYLQGGLNATNAFVALCSELRRAKRDKYSGISIISTNYDLFLDRALERLLNVTFNSMTSYQDFAGGWDFIKIHGSINWVQTFSFNNLDAGLRSERRIKAVNTNYRDIIDSRREIKIIDDRTIYENVGEGSEAVQIPVLAIPATKLRPLCDSSLIEKFHDRISRSKEVDVLVVGNSFRDIDLANTVHPIWEKTSKLLIIDADDTAASGILGRIKESSPIHSANLNVEFAQHFSSAIVDRIPKFLS